MLTYRLSLSVFWVAVAISGCGMRPAERAPQAVRSMTVCQLYTHRNSPPKEWIRVKATTFTDLRHGSILVDPNCPPGETIAFRFAAKLGPHSAATRFKEALNENPMRLTLRKFKVEVVGRFHQASPANTHGLFYIKKVDWFRRSR